MVVYFNMGIIFCFYSPEFPLAAFLNCLGFMFPPDLGALYVRSMGVERV